MTNPTLDRADITAQLSEQWSVIAELISGIDESAWRTPSPLPGWTLFDVVAHMVGTESFMLGDKPPARNTDEPKVDLSTLPHVRNEIGVLNEIWVSRLRPLSGSQLLGLFREVTDRRREFLGALTDAEWQAGTPSPVGQTSYGRFMRIRVFDCWMHELDIADTLGVRIDEGGPRGESAFAELLPGLGKTVSKAGKAPIGSRITFELTGPLARTLHIQVDDRAYPVETLDAAATVVIGLDAGLFARLCGGRTTADAHSTDIAISGDEELGNRLVRNLAFTI